MRRTKSEFRRTVHIREPPIPPPLRPPSICAPFASERLKSARTIRYAATYWMEKKRKRRRGRGGGKGGDRSRVEVAVGPLLGCPGLASTAEMKELIYQPESYNSLSTCIRTPSRTPVSDPRRRALASFSFPPFPGRSPLSLSASSKFLVSPILLSFSLSTGFYFSSFLRAFRASSRMAVCTRGFRVQFYPDVAKKGVNRER